jgi:hypothetical protein
LRQPAQPRGGQERPAPWISRPATAAAILGLALLLAGCIAVPGPSASGAGSGAPGSAGSGASATPLDTPAASPVGGSPADEACTSPPATGLSQTWTQLTGRDGGYRFSRPAGWSTMGSGVAVPAANSVSPATFRQTGLKADARMNVDVVRSPDSSAIVSAWALDGVTSRTTRLLEDELAWYKTQPPFERLIDDALRACLDGTRARGFSSRWTTDLGEKTVVIYMAQRDGTMFEVQMSATDPPPGAVLDELLRTWKWASAEGSGTPEDVGAQLDATRFAAFSTAGKLDQSSDHPNAATFKRTFPTTAQRIWILYELDDGVHDKITLTWRHEGTQVGKSTTFDYTDKTSFAWGWLTPDPATDRFVPGNYEVTATLKDAGDTITMAFTVE